MEIITLDLRFLDAPNEIASYLLITDRKVLVIETGPKATLTNLIENIREVGYRPNDVDGVIVTHIHLDHAGASGDLLKKLRKAYLYVHPHGYPHLHDPSRLWESSRSVLGELALAYGEPAPVPTKRMIKVDHRSAFDVGEDELVFIHTPGHASHHMTPFLRDSRVLFSGDAVGLYYIDRILPITPPPTNCDLAINSLKALMSLSPERIFFTHFGEYRPGREAIRRAIHVWSRWLNIVKEAYERSMSVEEAYQHLISNDEDARVYDGHIKERGYGRKEILINVKGIIEYLKWRERR